jgi:hypothetical protein
MPAGGTSGVGTGTAVRATFSTALDASTVTASSFTLRKVGGNLVPATVGYDEALQRATLTPSAALDPASSYTARVSTAVTADDGTPLPADYTWQFTTIDPAGLSVTATSPTDNATQISGAADVRATFTQALDPATVTSASFVLTGPGGAAVSATTSYDAASRTTILRPAASLQPSTAYAATLTTAIRSAGGSALGAPVTWHFTTSACPCRLFPQSETPVGENKPVQDGRSGPGPFSYEMGLKIRVTQPATLTSIRYFKSSGETGTHVGRVWTAAGAAIGQVTFQGESGSGWQQQDLATPIALTPGQTYVVSIGINAFFVMTRSGLESSWVSGPLASVADGANGVYGSVAGSFPDQSWSSSNYFIDAVVR